MNLNSRKTRELKTVWFQIGLLIQVSLTGIGCSQTIESNHSLSSASNSSNATTSTTLVEVDPVITPAQYQDGLRRAKTLLLQTPFLTSEEAQIQTLNEYETFISNYLSMSASTEGIRGFYAQLLQLEGVETITNFATATNNVIVDNDEPANLAAYLFENDMDFRLLLTADFCVGWTADGGLYQKTDCLNQGRIRRNDTTLNQEARFFRISVPTLLRAGALSTQAYLKKYDGALNFRRPSKTLEYFLCSVYPDPEETDPWTSQNQMLHPGYHTKPTVDQDCQSCHNVLNKTRGFFTGFGTLGEIQMGQVVTRVDNQPDQAEARTINDVEQAVIALADYEITSGKLRSEPFEATLDRYHGESIAALKLNDARAETYAPLSSYGRILADNPKFAQCTVQRAFNFAMGINQNILNRVPSQLSARLTAEFQESQYSLRKLLKKILSSTEYLNR